MMDGSVQDSRRARASLHAALRVYQAHRTRSERRAPLRLRSRTMALGEGHHSRWRGDDACVFDRVAAVRERTLRLLPESRAGWIYVELSLQSRRRREDRVSRTVRRFHPAPAAPWPDRKS